MNDPYAMPNGVLRNKLGITDHQLLDAAEADITRARLVMLTERPLPGAYDLGHLQAFHASGMDPRCNEDASVKSFLGDNSLLQQVLDELITTTG
ncbi:hypothetical protein [Streptomyces sp. NPDC014793]|uniref:hypothetical protein n=1 Tax=Streptomyces sp. NPDC014793 TaxID=3364914 RepID=UPI0036FA175F